MAISLMQALRDRLLVWFSHCEVQLQQAENVSSDLEAPWEILNLLQEELEQLECPRNEIRDMARNLIDQQKSSDMQRHLDDYIRVETDIMLKLAQMRLQTARKQQDILKAQQELDIPPETPPLVAGEGFNITDSGVFSFAERDSHIEALNTTTPGQAEITTSTPIQAEGAANDEELIPCSSPALVIPESLSIPPITSSMGAAMAAPAEAKAEEAALPEPSAGAEEEPGSIVGSSSDEPMRRTYAEVARSPVRQLPTKAASVPSLQPVPSARSDTQRQLELALEEWKHRLDRLETLVQSPAEVDPNDLVRKLLFH